MTEGRSKISAFVVCFNEEKDIADCLSSLNFCDEIVVIDSFSSDRTVEIAQAMGAKVLQRKWQGYIEQKAFGLSQVSNDWVVNLDADERVSSGLRKEIIALLSTKQQEQLAVGYYINRVVYHLGRWWRKGGWFPEYRLRLFQRTHVKWGGVEPHEKPIPDGRVDYLRGEILHYTYENLDDQFSRLHNFSSIAAREEFMAKRRPSLLSLLINPFFRAFKFYVLKKGYREGAAGLIVAIAEGYYAFMKYAKLWEMTYCKSETKDEEEKNEKSDQVSHRSAASN